MVLQILVLARVNTKEDDQGEEAKTAENAVAETELDRDDHRLAVLVLHRLAVLVLLGREVDVRRRCVLVQLRTYVAGLIYLIVPASPIDLPPL